MTVLLILLGIAAVHALAMLTAPEGYENETGFHFGRASVKRRRARQRQSPTSAARAAEDGVQPHGPAPFTPPETGHSAAKAARPGVAVALDGPNGGGAR